MLWGYFAYGEDGSENFTQDIAAALPVAWSERTDNG
jgi:hypothetical protein